MRKIFFPSAVILFMLLLSSCGGGTDNAAVNVSPDVSQSENTSDSRELLKQVQGHIDAFEYNRAVKLIEENPGLCSSPEFDGVQAALDEHFAGAAKDYHTAAMVYITRMVIDGFDYDTGFEGYDRESGTLDPGAIADDLPEALNKDELLITSRVTIECSGKAEDTNVKVTVEYCGRTAVYPE